MKLDRKEIFENPEYIDKFSRAYGRFISMFDRASNSHLNPPTVEGYSWYEGWMLGLQLSMVADPEFLKLSHCAHRAVSSTLSLHLEEKPTIQQRHEAVKYFAENKILGHFFESESEGTFLVLLGVNNWFTDMDGLPDSERWDCKIMPGLPSEICPEVKSYAQVDNACPKRTRGVKCNIPHAEYTVVTHAKKLSEELHLSSSKKSILTCTWVSCSNCVNLMVNNNEVFGSKINVFSIYGAQGDEDDIKMAGVVRDLLQEKHLGKLSGPLISVPKNPGYGWWPALPSSLRFLKQNSTPMIRNGDEAKVLHYALSLLD